MKKILFLLLLTLIHSAAAEETTQRIITIGGALTEIVYQLDKGELLVGSDTTSYYPSAAETLPKVGYQRTLSAEGIISLSPDLVIITEEAGPKIVLEQLKIAKIRLLELKEGRSIDDVINNINVIGKAINAMPKARHVIKELNNKKQNLDDLIATRNTRKKMMFILQYPGGGPMVAGKNTAADSIINLAGLENVVSAYDGYKPLTPEAAIKQSPEIILITTQGLELAGGKEGLMKIPGVALTPAGMQENIIAMDSLLMLGFGPRTVDAAKQLYERSEKL